MPALHNRERDTTDYRESSRQTSDDREISLGTGTILAIFFALALVCAVFFGLGYTMGRKSAQPATNAAASTDPSTSSSIFSGFKPSAGNPGIRTTSTPKQIPAAAPPPPDDPDSTIVTTPVTPSNSEGAAPTPQTSQVPRREATQQTASAPVLRESPRAAPPSTQALQPAAMPAANSNGTSIVQVAAVSHQEDADVLISALKRRGYAVFIRQEPQDHLLHVQVGPFATKKDAEAMRQRLLSDGYNAIVK